MENISWDPILLFMFVLPGFFLVWSFSKFSGKKIESDFAYLMFSVFWGVVMLGVIGHFSPDFISKLFENILAGMAVLVVLSILIGWFASRFYLEHKEWVEEDLYSKLLKKLRIKK